MAKDDARPTFLQQITGNSFTIDYVQRTLTLHRTAQLPPGTRKALNMFDLTPFGPDLHHYAILVQSMTLQTKQGRELTLTAEATNSSTRPIVVVIDTGLTGCIFSDSLVADGCFGSVPLDEIQGIRLQLDAGSSLSSYAPGVLTSDAGYWN